MNQGTGFVYNTFEEKNQVKKSSANEPLNMTKGSHLKQTWQGIRLFSMNFCVVSNPRVKFSWAMRPL
jgi:hypothetical protein